MALHNETIRRVNDVWRRLGSFAGILTPVLLLAGMALLAGNYAGEILWAWPGRRGRLSLPAVAFWTLAIAASVLLHLWYRWRQRAILRTLEDLIAGTHAARKAAEKTEKRTRWMPPKDFEVNRLQLTSVAKEVLANVRAAKTHRQLTVDETDEAIRIVLGCIASLARLFDGYPPFGIYCANVMLYRNSEDIPPDEVDRMNIVFCETGTHVHGLRGVLDLDVRLSTSTDVAVAEMDPEIRAFALPVPKKEDEWSPDHKQKFLPGAPSLFRTRERGGIDGNEPLLYICPDTFNLGDVCVRECEFSPAVTKRLQHYFQVEMGHRIRSFVSLALKRDGESIPWGVLNIHRNSPGILTDQQAAVQFFLRITDGVTAVLTELFDFRDSPSV